MKKFIALLMTALMLLSVIPVTATAETLTDDQGVTYTLSDDGTYYIVSDFDESVTEVNIPSTYNSLPVKEIGDYAFEYCYGLTSITIPASVTAISKNPFGGCDALEVIEVSEGNTVYHSKNNCLIETDTKTLISGCKTSIIPDDGSVTTIGNSAFYRCYGLTSITIPDSVTTIGGDAFYGCDNLEYNEYDNGLYLGNENNPYHAIINTISSEITTIDIHENVKVIAGGAFTGCYNLTSITIPDSVTTIGDWAFSSCANLTSITISGAVTNMGYYVFSDCSNLTDMYCEADSKPDGWSDSWDSGCSAAVHWQWHEPCYGNHTYKDIYITACSIEGCTYSREAVVSFGIDEETKTCVFYGKDPDYTGEIIIPEEYEGYTVVAIGNLNFPNATKVVIPNSVVTICVEEGYTQAVTVSDSAYTQYDNAYYLGTEENPYLMLVKTVSDDITSCEIHPNTKMIYSYAFRGSAIESIVIPDSVEKVGYGVFRGCRNLESVVIGESVKELPGSLKFGGVFYACASLKNVDLGNLESIQEHSFGCCSSLETITIPITVMTIGWEAFTECENLTDIYCETESQPEGWYSNTEFDSYWNDGNSATIHWGYTGDNTSEPEVSEDESSTPVEDESSTPEDDSSTPKDESSVPDNEDIDTEESGNNNENANVELGDINGNSEIDSLDYILLKRAYFGTFELSDTAKSAGDINGNGEIDSLDYILLKRAYFGTYEIK